MPITQKNLLKGSTKETGYLKNVFTYLTVAVHHKPEAHQNELTIRSRHLLHFITNSSFATTNSKSFLYFMLYYQ